MNTPPPQPLKRGIRQLGCRANIKQEALITAAFMLSPEHNTRNGFILDAALAAARGVLQANKVTDDAVYAEAGIGILPVEPHAPKEGVTRKKS